MTSNKENNAPIEESKVFSWATQPKPVQREVMDTPQRPKAPLSLDTENNLFHTPKFKPKFSSFLDTSHGSYPGIGPCTSSPFPEYHLKQPFSERNTFYDGNFSATSPIKSLAKDYDYDLLFNLSSKEMEETLPDFSYTGEIAHPYPPGVSSDKNYRRRSEATTDNSADITCGYLETDTKDISIQEAEMKDQEIFKERERLQQIHFKNKKLKEEINLYQKTHDDVREERKALLEENERLKKKRCTLDKMLNDIEKNKESQSTTSENERILRNLQKKLASLKIDLLKVEKECESEAIHCNHIEPQPNDLKLEELETEVKDTIRSEEDKLTRQRATHSKLVETLFHLESYGVNLKSDTSFVGDGGRDVGDDESMNDKDNDVSLTNTDPNNSIGRMKFLYSQTSLDESLSFHNIFETNIMSLHQELEEAEDYFTLKPQTSKFFQQKPQMSSCSTVRPAHQTLLEELQNAEGVSISLDPSDEEPEPDPKTIKSGNDKDIGYPEVDNDLSPDHEDLDMQEDLTWSTQLDDATQALKWLPKGPLRFARPTHETLLPSESFQNYLTLNSEPPNISTLAPVHQRDTLDLSNNNANELTVPTPDNQPQLSQWDVNSNNDEVSDLIVTRVDPEVSPPSEMEIDMPLTNNEVSEKNNSDSDDNTLVNETTASARSSVISTPVSSSTKPNVPSTITMDPEKEAMPFPSLSDSKLKSLGLDKNTNLKPSLKESPSLLSYFKQAGLLLVVLIVSLIVLRSILPFSINKDVSFESLLEVLFGHRLQLLWPDEGACT